MLDQARRDMQETLIANRERAIQAITQRNQLEKLLNDQKAKSANLENQAVAALKSGDRDLARNIMREKANTDTVAAQLQTSFDQATVTVNSVKVAIQRQQEEVQKKTAEALALKAQWKNAQIQNSIAKAMDGLSFENQFEGFGAAAERIQNAQSEASARQEMHSESLQGRIQSMQSNAMDLEAEQSLQALEERLGMRAPAVAPAETQTAVSTGSTVSATPPAPPVTPELTEEQKAAASGEADKALEELERRLKPGS